MIIKIAKKLKFLAHNLRVLSAVDLSRTIHENKANYETQQREISFLNVLAGSPEGFKHEVEYLKGHGWCHFPYEQVKKASNIISGIDGENHFPYVMHRDKRLYFPSSYSIDRCIALYEGYISEECLLGGDYREKAPHQYQTDSFKIEDGEVLVDVGCAEALLSLDTIEKVSKVYLLEADPNWIPALQLTFRDYLNKVSIVNKFVSDNDTETTITLKTLLKDEQTSKLFIKMDIEGAEVSVLRGSFDFLRNRSNIKIACCTYHRKNDATIIKSLFDEMGFRSEFSEGYMLFLGDAIEYPYFRHGIIRGQK